MSCQARCFHKPCSSLPFVCEVLCLGVRRQLVYFSKHLLSLYSVWGTVLGTQDSKMSTIKSLAFWNVNRNLQWARETRAEPCACYLISSLPYIYCPCAYRLSLLFSIPSTKHGGWHMALGIAESWPLPWMIHLVLLLLQMKNWGWQKLRSIPPRSPSSDVLRHLFPNPLLFLLHSTPYHFPFLDSVFSPVNPEGHNG